MNEDELLYDVPEVLSPRLQWEKEHEIMTHCATHEDLPWIAISMKVCKERLPELTKEEKTDIGALFAGYCRFMDEGRMIGYGKTRDAAIDDLIAERCVPPMENL